MVLLQSRIMGYALVAMASTLAKAVGQPHYGPFHTSHKITVEDRTCPACQAFGKPDALFLFTGRSLEHLLRDGGSQSWRLSPASVRSVKYAICFQNQYPPTN